MRKLSGAITGIHERAVEAELDGAAAPAPASSGKAKAPAAPADDDDDDDEDEGAGAAPRATAAAASALLAADPELRRYAVPDDPWAWAAALKPGGKVTAAEPPRVVSVRHTIGGGAASSAPGATGASPGAGLKRRTEQGGAGGTPAAAAAEAEVYDPRNRLGDSGGGSKLKHKKARA